MERLKAGPLPNYRQKVPNCRVENIERSPMCGIAQTSGRWREKLETPVDPGEQPFGK